MEKTDFLRARPGVKMWRTFFLRKRKSPAIKITWTFFAAEDTCRDTLAR